MTAKLTCILILVVALTGCATLPTEYTSPCACDYKPLNQQIEEDGRAVT